MRVGAYPVEGELGRGGAGVVLRGRAPDGRAVAIKVLLHHGPEAVARFERERRLLATLGEAEGVVPLLDAGVEPAGPYVVMPLVEGGTLRRRLARGPLGIAEALAVVRALAASVGRAHERGIVHRDLKPENVLFDGDRPLVADLGLAKHYDRALAAESASLSRTHAFLGTVAYLAPEQARDAKSAGPAADVFALGAILHECLRASPPSRGRARPRS